VTIEGDHVQINQLGSRWSGLRVLRRKRKDQRNGDGEYHKPPSLTESLSRSSRFATAGLLPASYCTETIFI
jgi:hypothetical protein